MSRKLVFDGDASQTTARDFGGEPCTLCHGRPPTLIRVREKVAGGTQPVAFVCPDCVARMFVQVERLSLWHTVSGVVLRAIHKVLLKKRLPSEAKQVNTRKLKS